MLTTIAVISFIKLGASTVEDVDETKIKTDPKTEEEFLRIKYTPSDLVISWVDYLTEYQKQLNIVQQKLLRTQRDYLLAKSDWIMQPDVIETIANKDEWIAYRQALRDLTNTVTEYIWKENYSDLDFKKMNMPQAPAVIRR